ncbi:MAG: DUF4198 domain-containing protein [Acidobacteriota bacterium]
MLRAYLLFRMELLFLLLLPVFSSRLKAEIIPLVNPYTLKKGDKLKVRVLFMGRPLSGTEVFWSYPGKGETFAGTVITGEYGDALIPISYVLNG